MVRTAALLAFLAIPCMTWAQEDSARSDDPRAGALLQDETLAGVGVDGYWAASQRDCFGPGMVTVTPRAISGMGMSCSIERIDRKGGVVVFHGACDRGQGPVPESVETILIANKLSFGFARAGNTIEGLMRCLRTQ